MTLFDVLQDGAFAAVAAIGFGSISNIPQKSFLGCGFLAAIGHVVRFLCMKSLLWNIVPSSLIAGLSIGLLSIPASKYWKCPAESLSFPSLLPMIPGMYAYKSIQSFVECINANEENLFMHFFYLFNYNIIICILAILMLVIGITIPLFMFKAETFSATR